MNFDFFNDTKAAYIAVNSDGFCLNGKQSRKLECFIREITPVRKLFKGKKVECYSNDAKKGKNGECCAFCPERMNCRQRIRLTLLVHDSEEKEIPARLEINNNSFGTLKKMLEPVKEEDLANMLVVLEVKERDKYLQIQFNPVF